MRVVPDSNVVISAFAFGGTPFRFLETAFRDQHVIVTCDSILAEVHAILDKPFFRSRLSDPDAPLRIVADYARIAAIVNPANVPAVCRDAKDDMVLACAVAASADAIVTGDKDLLALDPYHQIRIIPPADALAALQQQG